MLPRTSVFIVFRVVGVLILILLSTFACKNSKGQKGSSINESGKIPVRLTAEHIQLKGNTIQAGPNFSLTLQRTLRIPDDGKSYPLPPGLGAFPIRKVEDYKDRVPKSWLKKGGYFIPMYQREAMWLNFQAAYWRPNALKVGVGKVDAITGKNFDKQLDGKEQNYLVCPTQPWLDGINAGNGFIRQFVAMPLGKGYTVEGQVTGKEEFGGLQLIVFEPKPGKFPDKPPVITRVYEDSAVPMVESAKEEESSGGEMGLAAGGKMEQKIYPDPHGVTTWDENNYVEINIHIVNSEMYQQITGEAPPESPVTAKTYTDNGYPWFALYDEGKGTLKESDILDKVKSVKEKDIEKYGQDPDDNKSVKVPEDQVKKLKK